MSPRLSERSQCTTVIDPEVTGKPVVEVEEGDIRTAIGGTEAR